MGKRQVRSVFFVVAFTAETLPIFDMELGDKFSSNDPINYFLTMRNFSINIYLAIIYYK